eukprot:gene7362-3133_t
MPARRAAGARRWLRVPNCELRTADCKGKTAEWDNK